VDYLLCQIYGALALFNEKARGVRDTSMTTTQWEQIFVAVFRDLKSKLSYEACQRYEMFKAVVSVPTTGLSANAAATSPAGVLHNPARGGNGVRNEAQTSHFQTQVCVKDVMRCFDIPNEKGQRYKACGSRCLRRHMSDLMRAPVALSSAIEQVRLVIRDETLAQRTVDAVKADLSGRFTA
jgi:hypothetical protein